MRLWLGIVQWTIIDNRGRNALKFINFEIILLLMDTGCIQLICYQCLWACPRFVVVYKTWKSEKHFMQEIFIRLSISSRIHLKLLRGNIFDGLSPTNVVTGFVFLRPCIESHEVRTLHSDVNQIYNSHETYTTLVKDNCILFVWFVCS